MAAHSSSELRLINQLDRKINWPQWAAIVLPLALIIGGSWITMDRRLTVVEERQAIHIASDEHRGATNRTNALEKQALANSLKIDTIIREQDEIKKLIIRYYESRRN